MAFKVDKDVLIKHHFWILTGAFFLFALLAGFPSLIALVALAAFVVVPI